MQKWTEVETEYQLAVIETARSAAALKVAELREQVAWKHIHDAIHGETREEPNTPGLSSLVSAIVADEVDALGDIRWEPDDARRVLELLSSADARARVMDGDLSDLAFLAPIVGPIIVRVGGAVLKVLKGAGHV